MGNQRPGPGHSKPPQFWIVTLKKNNSEIEVQGGFFFTNASFRPPSPFCIPGVLETDEQMPNHSILKKHEAGKSLKCHLFCPRGPGQNSIKITSDRWFVRSVLCTSGKFYRFPLLPSSSGEGKLLPGRDLPFSFLICNTFSKREVLICV